MGGNHDYPSNNREDRNRADRKSLCNVPRDGVVVTLNRNGGPHLGPGVYLLSCLGAALSAQ